MTIPHHFTWPFFALVLLAALQASCSSPGEEGNDADADAHADADADADAHADSDADAHADSDARADSAGELDVTADEDAVDQVHPPHGQLGDQILIYDGRNPDIASDSLGDPHLVFDRRNVGVFYAKGSGTSGEFPETPVQLGPAGAIEPRIFIDKDDNAHVVWAVSSNGSNGGGYEGWYTNNIGGSWRTPIQVAANGDGDNGDGGLERVTCGRVVKVPDQDLVVTSWSGQGDMTILVSLSGLAAAPVVQKKVRIQAWIPGLVALSSSAVRTVARRTHGEWATDYDLELNPTGSFNLIDVLMSGECGDGFLEKSTGLVHYTGTAAGDSNSRVWYTNDERLETGQQALLGMEAAELGATGWYWADVCVDALGQAYVTHSYIDTESGPCTDAKCAGYVAYVDDDQLISVLLVSGYKGQRVGPYCAPAAAGGIHVVYHIVDEIFYRTVDVP